MAMDICLIGVPMELGANREGIRKGPGALRNAGVREVLLKAGHQVSDKGDLAVPLPLRRYVPRLMYMDAIGRVNRSLCETVDETVREGKFPLVIGGDHSIAIGTIAGLSRHYRSFGVIWIDAHGDLNTERTTPSGHIHGMSLAASLGFGHPELTMVGGRAPKVDPKRTVLIGARSLDPGERRFIREQGIRIFTVADIRREGLDTVISEALRIAGSGTLGIHLSFDLDVLEPGVAPGVSTPVPGGLNLREAEEALVRIGGSGKLIGAELVELNPDLDRGRTTASAGIRLIGKLFGGI